MIQDSRVKDDSFLLVCFLSIQSVGKCVMMHFELLKSIWIISVEGGKKYCLFLHFRKQYVGASLWIQFLDLNMPWFLPCGSGGFFFLLLNSDGLIIFLEKSQLRDFLFYVQLGNLSVNFKRWAKHSWCSRHCSDPFILSLYLFSSIKYIGKRGKEWTSSLYRVHWLLAKQKELRT